VTEYTANAPFTPPEPEEPQPPGFWRRNAKVVAIGTGLFLTGLVIGTAGSDAEAPASAAPSETTVTATVTSTPAPATVTVTGATEQVEAATPEVVTETVTETATETVEVEVQAAVEPATETEPADSEPESDMTVAQSNAVRSAQSYLEYTAFSKSGLVDQLEFEGYSNADAGFAVNHIEVDWMEQAAKSAESYLEYTAFSRQGLIDQLVFEGFTQEQATHGADSVGL
jgi:hypothetical protein